MDNGLTWEDRGFVLESGSPVDCDYANGYFTGGNGDFNVDHSRTSIVLLCLLELRRTAERAGHFLARSRFEDRGQPGTVLQILPGELANPAWVAT